ncbi:MAG: hypothetical protein IJQ73_03540 [Kiritimatiellae bacterium]|nr:hypothetical protein [Kiritimatiellia bacterium]
MKSRLFPLFCVASALPVMAEVDSWYFFNLRDYCHPVEQTEAMSGSLVVDTDGLPTMTLDGETFATGQNWDGVAVFDFSTLRIGSGCTVSLKGDRPLVIRAEDIEIDTPIVVPSGRLGGGTGGIAGGCGSGGSAAKGGSGTATRGSGGTGGVGA